MKKLVMGSVAVLAASFGLSACAHNQPTDTTAAPAMSTTHEPPPPPPAPSVAEMHGKKKSKINGNVIFKSEADQIHVIAEFTGLKPNSDHGLHVHENGSCDGEKFEKAGAHFNPAHSEHGSTDSKKRHAGDLGNIHSDANGNANLDVKIASTPGVGTFNGKSVILHKNSDDLQSQPAGNSGDKIACGLIKEQR